MRVTKQVRILRNELLISIMVDHWPICAPEMRALRQQLTDLGDEEWLKLKGWQIV